MKQGMKSILVISLIIIGVVSPQTPPQQQNGTGQNKTKGEGQNRPQGNGTMRNGPKPDGPNNLPPQVPGITDKLAAITDNTLTRLRNILQYLPPLEQDLIADCFNSNTDTSRLISADCYVGNFTENVRKPTSKGFSDVLTNSSSSNRQGLGCLQKMANTFGNSTDTTTSLITSDVVSIVNNQVPFNQATSNFVTNMLNLMNARRKYLLTTTLIINQVISSNDTNGYAEGFVYTEDEQKTVVANFKVYAIFIYNFFSNLNSKVSSIQGMIGRLDQCKPPESTAAPTRLLQGSSNQQGNKTEKAEQPKEGNQQQGGNKGNNTTSNGAMGNNTNKPEGQGPKGNNSTGSNTDRPEGPRGNNNMGNNTERPDGPRGNNSMGNNTDRPEGPRGNNSMGNNTERPEGKGPRGNNSMGNNTAGKGGKPQGKDGRPQNDVPKGVGDLKSNVTALLASKTGLWATLNTELSTNLTPESGYRPNGGLLRSILQKVSANTEVLKREFSKIQRNNETCTQDYLFSCANGVCDCTENCPTNLLTVKTMSLSSGVSSSFNKQLRYLQNLLSAQQDPPKDNKSDDFPNEYVICSFCLSQKRYLFAEGKFSITGNLIDFTDGSKANDLGKQSVQAQNDCAQSLKNGTSSEKKQCRGDINDECGKKMDDACKSTGLYDILVNNPVPTSPLPTQCDDSLATYTESNCFNWIMPKITKATIVFDYKGFLDLPRGIANSISAGGSPNGVRLLQTIAVKVVSNDVVAQFDTKAIIPTNIAQVTTSEVSVDSSTVAAAASASNYINSLSQTTSQVTLSNTFINYSINLLIVCFIGLLI